MEKGPAVSTDHRTSGPGAEGTAATTTSSAEELRGELYALDFGVHKSIRYHNKRRSWFETVHRVGMAITGIAGSAAFASLVSNNHDTSTNLATSMALIVAVIGAINVAFDPAARARKAESLARDYFRLASDISKCHELTLETITELRQKRFAIEAEEPPPLDALNVLCHNIEAEARGLGPEHRYYLSWIQKVFAHLITLPPNRFDQPLSG